MSETSQEQQHRTSVLVRVWGGLAVFLTGELLLYSTWQSFPDAFARPMEAGRLLEWAIGLAVGVLLISKAIAIFSSGPSSTSGHPWPRRVIGWLSRLFSAR